MTSAQRVALVVVGGSPSPAGGPASASLAPVGVLVVPAVDPPRPAFVTGCTAVLIPPLPAAGLMRGGEVGLAPMPAVPLVGRLAVEGALPGPLDFEQAAMNMESTHIASVVER